MRSCAILGLLPVLLSTTAAARPAIPAEIAAPSAITQYRCLAMRELKGGALALARSFRSDGAPVDAVGLYWSPRNQQLSPEHPLSLVLSYEPPSTDAPKGRRRPIILHLEFLLVPPLPATATMQIGSPSPPRLPDASTRSPLTLEITHTGHHLTGSLAGAVPLDKLLTHAGNHRTLPWTLIRPPGPQAPVKVLARGTLDIVALREVVAALPALRKVLAAKSAQPLKRCDRVDQPDPPPAI